MPPPALRFALLPMVLALGSLPSMAWGQEPSSPPTFPAAIRAITLPDAIAFARTHQPQLRIALSRIAVRTADADVPRAQWLPTFGATAQLFGATANNTTGTYVSPGAFMDVPRIGGTRVVSSGSFQPYASSLVAAGLTQELFDFGRIAAQAAASDALVDVERQRARATTFELTFDVEETYFSVLAAKAILQASDDAFERSRVHRDFAGAGVRAGLRSPIELTRADADLARFEIGRIRARGGLSTAQMTLAAVIGSDEAAVDAAGTPSLPADLPALDTAIAQARARDPRILAVLAELHAEEQRTRAIAAELRPDFSVTASLSGRAGGAPPSGNGVPADQQGFLPEVPNWDLGVVLSWPLFDGTNLARRGASRAREQVRREEIILVDHNATATIRLAYAAVDVARTALPGLQRSVDAARANYAQAEARFRAGLGTSIELADAEALRTDAEIQLALGQFELARTRSSFGRAIAEGA